MDDRDPDLNAFLDGLIADLELLLQTLKAARLRTDQRLTWRISGVIHTLCNPGRANKERREGSRAIGALDELDRIAEKLISRGYEDPPFATRTMVAEAKRTPQTARALTLLFCILGGTVPEAKRTIDVPLEKDAKELPGGDERGR